MQFKKFDKPYAVEELVFKMKESYIDTFIQIDHDIWTAMLSKYKGFVRKENWVNREKGEITSVIYWSSLEEWKQIPAADLEKTQSEFDNAVGAKNYEFVAAPHEQNQKYLVTVYE